MDAKEYLSNLYYLNSKIKEDRQRIADLKEQASKIVASPSPDKVHTSSSKDKMSAKVCTWVDIERQVEANEGKVKAIESVLDMLTPYERIILYKRYTYDMSLGEVAREVRRSYSWISKKHNAGIKKVQAILDKKEVRV